MSLAFIPVSSTLLLKIHIIHLTFPCFYDFSLLSLYPLLPPSMWLESIFWIRKKTSRLFRSVCDLRSLIELRLPSSFDDHFFFSCVWPDLLYFCSSLPSFRLMLETSDGNTKQIPNLIMSELNDSNHSNNACGGFGGENNCSSSGCDKTKAKTVEEDHLSESPQAVLQPSLTHTSSYGSTSATTTFYPSPYASVTVTEGQLAAAVNGAHHFTNGHTLIGTLKPLSVLLEDRRERNHSGSSNISCLVDSPSHLRIETCESSPYATVKRTPRLAKTDRNIYDYPGGYCPLMTHHHFFTWNHPM